jgi:hypothetical protein
MIFIQYNVFKLFITFIMNNFRKLPKMENFKKWLENYCCKVRRMNYLQCRLVRTRIVNEWVGN